jgi:hypothetical protein
MKSIRKQRIQAFFSSKLNEHSIIFTFQTILCSTKGDFICGYLKDTCV